MKTSASLQHVFVAAAIACASCGHAQSLASLKIGDAESKLAALGKPTSTDDTKGMTFRKWTVPGGNDLSVTTDASGKIVYIEADWNPGATTDPECDLPGLTFAKTTLAELRKRFGSNGFGFTEQSGQMLAPDGAVMVNSYEANGNVITFYNKVSNREAARLDPEGQGTIADRAKLDAISIADAEYAKRTWGDRIYDPQYKPVIWK